MRNSYLQAFCGILLTLYGTMSLFGRNAGDIFLLSFLLAVAAGFGAMLPAHPTVSTALSSAYLVYAIFISPALPFIPLVLYEPLRRLYASGRGTHAGVRFLFVFLPAVLSIALHASASEPSELYSLILGCLVSWLMAYSTATITAQSRSINDIRDTAVEHRLDLEQRNRALREQQDVEIYTATLRERNRIAREIHDSVGHILSRSILMTGALATINRDEAMKAPIASLEEQLNEAMTSIRTSVHDLHDDSVDLQEAAGLLIRDFRACPARFECSVSRNVPREVKYCFLSVLREALTNVEKHSNATMVRVRMIEHPSIYQLTIHDNGTKIDQEVLTGPREAGAGIGLENMRERVRSLGGTITITDEGGFRIFISIPKKEA